MADVVILGVFVADTAYRATRQPRMGETILGNSFALGPGGKGSNQAVAAAMAAGGAAGGPVKAHFISKLGEDPFADMALATWEKAGVHAAVTQSRATATPVRPTSLWRKRPATRHHHCTRGRWYLQPGRHRCPSRFDHRRKCVRHTVEQPMNAAVRALELAKQGGARTILNPAPAADLPDDMLAMCDFVTPNESETEALVGKPVVSVDDAREAAKLLRAQGAGAAIITLGEQGAYFDDGATTAHVPAFDAGPVAETTGAGDAFNGAFAVALAEGRDPVDAIRFGCATASISVTRPGTAPSMPSRAEIDALLASQPA